MVYVSKPIHVKQDSSLPNFSLKFMFSVKNLFGGFLKMKGTPKSSILLLFSILKHPATGVPPFQETPIFAPRADGNPKLPTPFQTAN